MIQAIVFDLDDTLYPEVQFVYSGYRAVSEEVQGQWGIAIYDELVALFEEGRRGDLFTPVLRRHLGNVKETCVQQLVWTYRQHEPHITPFPEARDVLRRLKVSHSLALISDGYLAVQERKLDALRLCGYLDVVVFSDRWGRDFWKPHSRPYEACARDLGLDPTDLIYVADNPAKDFVTARRLGMGTVRVRREGTLHQKVVLSPQYEADHNINDLTELLALLETWD